MKVEKDIDQIQTVFELIKEVKNISPELIRLSENINQSIFICDFPENEINRERIRVTSTNIEEGWIYGMLHYFNHYRSKLFKFKNRDLELATKPRGKLLIKTYELSKECYFRQRETGILIPWDNGMDWFAKIWWDFVGTEFEDSLPELKVNYSNFKKAVIDRRLAHVKAMKDNENPFLIFKDATGLQTLIDVARNLAFSHEKNQFREMYWKPFLKAYSEDIAERRSSRWGYVKFGGAGHQVVRGQGRPRSLKSTK